MKEVNNSNKGQMALTKENYKLMLIGLGIILVGFLLMLGSSNNNPAVFNTDIFSFRRITLAPIVIVSGFVFEIYAIMKKPKSE